MRKSDWKVLIAQMLKHNNAFQFLEHVSIFQTSSSSAIMDIQ